MGVFGGSGFKPFPNDSVHVKIIILKCIRMRSNSMDTPRNPTFEYCVLAKSLRRLMFKGYRIPTDNYKYHPNYYKNNNSTNALEILNLRIRLIIAG